MKKNRWLQILIMLLPYSFGLVFVALFFLIYTDGADGKQGSIKITMPGEVSFEMDLKNNQISLESILDNIQADTRKEKQLLTLLEDKKIYKINDPAIAEALQQRNFNEQPGKGIRELWKKLKGPFKYVSTVEVSVDPSLSLGKAKVCQDSLLLDLDLILLRQTKAIDVTVNQYFVDDAICQQPNNILFISREDAQRLSIRDTSKSEKIMLQATFKNPDSSSPVPPSINTLSQN